LVSGIWAFDVPTPRPTAKRKRAVYLTNLSLSRGQSIILRFSHLVLSFVQLPDFVMQPFSRRKMKSLWTIV